MRGEILMKALEMFGHGVEAAYAITVEPFFVGSRGAMARQISRTIRDALNHICDAHHESQYYHNLVAQLKRDGLIIAGSKQSFLPFTLTKKGREKLKKLREQLGGGALPKSPRYAKETSATLTVVTFDIPERDRNKRDWVRSALKNLSFRMLQKSVWIGKIKIPEAFLEDLKRLRIMDKVEILGITKQGTLRSLS